LTKIEQQSIIRIAGGRGSTRGEKRRSARAIKIFDKERLMIRTKAMNLAVAVAMILGVMSFPASARYADKDIVDTAVEAGQFTTLAKALEATGLIETLKSEGPFTVFAPTDEAFAKLPAGTIESLLKDPEKLKQILLYHVVSGKVMAKDVVKIKSAKTVQGSSVKVKAGKAGVMVDNANVIKTDIAATNGVIHVIDSVILPK
jgi:uncharacterized surface protein with fasciclin (FAS1) repeats